MLKGRFPLAPLVMGSPLAELCSPPTYHGLEILGW